MRLHDTLSRQTKNLQPLEDNKVKLYVCGLTVYSQPHIGNWVSYIYWDALVRTLRASGYKVKHVQNITDVGHLVSDADTGEDKMEKGAKNEGLTAWDVAEKYIKIADHEAYVLLGLLRPDHMPRATQLIPQQIDFVKELEKRGFTYEISDDGIYFDTSKLENYGKLARLDIKGLKPGARVAFAGKRNVTDFALWKFSPKDSKRDMEWDSPWGKGFPGWHLECSVMAREFLGNEIDIHTGGVDHIPIHHTNEIAQTEALTGKPLSQFWVHNNHLKVDGGKMAKALGNIYTLQDIADLGYNIDAFKLMVLSKHYRTEGNFTWEILKAAQNRLNKWQAFADLLHQPKDIVEAEWLHMREQAGYRLLAWREPQMFIKQQLQDDLNTPEAIMWLDRLSDEIQVLPDNKRFLRCFREFLEFADNIFGFRLSNRNDITDKQKDMIAKRTEAREKGSWELSDSLRKRLSEEGIAVRDTSYGPIWSRL